MKTKNIVTVTIDEKILEDGKKVAQKEGLNFSDYVERLLENDENDFVEKRREQP